MIGVNWRQRQPYGRPVERSSNGGPGCRSGASSRRRMAPIGMLLAASACVCMVGACGATRPDISTTAIPITTATPGGTSPTPRTSPTGTSLRVSDVLGFKVPGNPKVVGTIASVAPTPVGWWFWNTPGGRIQLSVRVQAWLKQGHKPVKLPAPSTSGDIIGPWLVWCGANDGYEQPPGTSQRSFLVKFGDRTCRSVPATPPGKYWGTGDGFATWATMYTTVTLRSDSPIRSKNKSDLRLSFFTVSKSEGMDGSEAVALIWYLPGGEALVSKPDNLLLQS